MDVPHRAMASPVGRRGSPPLQVHAPPPRAHDARGVRTRGPGVSFLVGAPAAPVRSTGRRDHVFTSAIITISALGTTAQNQSYWLLATGLGICCACGAELLALGHSGVASFCCLCFFFGRGLHTDDAVCMFLIWRT